MKNYNKKLIIMFVMLLTVIGFGTIQNGTMANAATVGQQLLQSENGWTRYSYDSKEITYDGTGWRYDSTWAHNYLQTYQTGGAKIKFNFTGTKLRILASYWSTYTNDADIIIDGNIMEKYVVYDNDKCIVAPILVYEKSALTDGEHSVQIINNTGRYLPINSIDVEGILKPYSEQVKTDSITLDKSSIDLTEGDTQQLTATTTPASVGVTWTSSDSSIATVDSTGKSTGIKEGTCTITATTADGLTATCTVNVTKEIITPPVTDPQGDGSLFIELVDGNIKSYDVTASEITNFIKWYNNRDNDDSQSPYYQFTKGTYKDYVVHDKIDWFEVR